MGRPPSVWSVDYRIDRGSGVEDTLTYVVKNPSPPNDFTGAMPRFSIIHAPMSFKRTLTLPDRHKLAFTLSLLLTAGFLATSLFSYFASKASIHDAIVAKELPLTSDNVYSEIQKDLVRPILVSSTMAQDTFLRDWIIDGEQDRTQIIKYLETIKERYGAFTSFLVSEKSRLYYQAKGVLKSVKQDEPRDAWYFRVRKLQEPYEINVDPDLANQDKLTIFINYRVLDYRGELLGVTGVGLTVDAVSRLLRDYRARYGRRIYFLDASGKIVLTDSSLGGGDIHTQEGIAKIADQVLSSNNASFEYRRQGRTHLLNVRYVPDLKWYLCVEKVEDEALDSIRNILFLNIAIFLVVTSIVLILVVLTVNYYQKRLEGMANTDILTGLYNRRGLELLLSQGLEEARRKRQPLAAIMIDIDQFKKLNDEQGHLAGDQVLRSLAEVVRKNLRQSDIACRWGGEELFILLKEADESAAAGVAEKIRLAVAAASFQFGKRQLAVTVSCGVAQYAAADDSEDQFVARADAALYLAKHGGRNQVRLASESAESPGAVRRQ